MSCYEMSLRFREFKTRAITLSFDDGHIDDRKMVNILNPEIIVIGSIFARSHSLLWEPAKRIIEKEALCLSAKCCEIVPAAFNEQIGDYAAIATALL